MKEFDKCQKELQELQQVDEKHAMISTLETTKEELEMAQNKFKMVKHFLGRKQTEL